jgi:hypothetical protein
MRLGASIEIISQVYNISEEAANFANDSLASSTQGLMRLLENFLCILGRV